MSAYNMDPIQVRFRTSICIVIRVDTENAQLLMFPVSNESAGRAESKCKDPLVRRYMRWQWMPELVLADDLVTDPGATGLLNLAPTQASQFLETLGKLRLRGLTAI